MPARHRGRGGVCGAGLTRQGAQTDRQIGTPGRGTTPDRGRASGAGPGGGTWPSRLDRGARHSKRTLVLLGEPKWAATSAPGARWQKQSSANSSAGRAGGGAGGLHKFAFGARAPILRARDKTARARHGTRARYSIGAVFCHFVARPKGDDRKLKSHQTQIGARPGQQ